MTIKNQESDNWKFVEETITRIDFEILVSKLPPQQKKILTLKEQGYTLKEIAQQNNIKGIYNLYKIIKNKIKNLL